jgi:hypothetical protein
MRTAVSGPIVLYGNDNPQQVSDTETGPNIDYQANALIDSRFVSQATAGGEGAQGGILCWHNPAELEILSSVPQAASNVLIAASQTPAASAFFTLATANAVGLAVAIPLTPYGSGIQPGGNVVPVLALDFGFAIGTTTTAPSTASVVTLTGPTPGGYTGTATYASRFFYPGQRIIIPGAGLNGLPLFTQVTATDRYAAPGFALAATGTITIANPALTVATNVGIGTSDQEYGVTASPVVKAGASRVYDPAQLTARNVTITAGSTTGSGNVLVRGYDIYGQPMSEQLAIPATAITVQGNKAFKYISSVQALAGAVTTGGVSVGTGSKLGFPVRIDIGETAAFWQGGVQLIGTGSGAFTGVVFADQTVVATSTTGDVRGTWSPAGSVPNGTFRYVIYAQTPIHQTKVATNINPQGLVGVVQA